MISNDQQLTLVRDQMTRLEAALQSLASTVRPQSESQFRVLAEGYVDQLDVLRREIDFYLGVLAVKEPEPEVEVAVEDERAGLGETRLSAVTKVADHFRRALRTTVESIRNTLALSDQENITSDFLNRLCDPPLQAVLPGSVRVQLSRTHAEVGHELYADGLKLLSLAIRAASSDVSASAELEKLPIDQQKAAWNAVKVLAPKRGDLVETIGFGGTFVGAQKRVQFTLKTRKRILRRLREIGETNLTRSVSGVLEEIDYGHRLFTLREADSGATVERCKYSKAFDASVDSLRNTAVEVAGTRRTNALRTTPLHVKSIREASKGVE